MPTPCGRPSTSVRRSAAPRPATPERGRDTNREQLPGPVGHSHPDDPRAGNGPDDSGAIERGSDEDCATGDGIERRDRPRGEREARNLRRRQRTDGGRDIGRRVGRSSRVEQMPRPTTSRDPPPRARSRGTATARTRARISSDCASAAACSAPTGRPAFGASSKVDGIPGVPNAAASASHRSRQAVGVSAGASRCAPASHVSAHARGTTRYASYPPPPVASHRPPAHRCATRSTSRAASPIAVVVTRRCASGSQAWVSAPCCETTTSGPNAAARVGIRARTAASHAVSPCMARAAR